MTASARVVVEADGGSRGNPGPAGYGAVVLDADTREVLAERAEFLGVASNNVAEYRGLIAGLAAARDLGATDVVVRMDSKLVVEQMSGRWQVKHPAMKPLAREAGELVRAFASVSFGWIPRAENAHADRLANEAMDRGTGVAPKAARAPKAGAAPAWTPPSGERTRLVLVRHGSTVHSKELRFSGRNDLPLDAAGEQQAAALAAALAAHPFGTVSAVVGSPLRRTQQTAQAIAAGLGLAVDTHDDLAETDFGAWEGRTIDELPADEVAAWRAPSTPRRRGESFAAVGRRVRRARESIVAAHPGGTVVAVSHVTPIKSLVRFALDAPPQALFRMHLDTASVSVIDYFADGASSLRVFNDTSHLR